MSDQRIFLDLEGVKGDSAFGTYKNKITIDSWTWNVGNSGDLHSKGSGGSFGGKPSMGDLILSKHVDSSSATVIQAVLGQRSFKTATLHILTQDGTEWCKMSLSPVIITQVDVSSYGASASETIRLHFQKIQMDISSLDEEGKKSGGAVSMAFDITDQSKK
jgi:type VI protein secretion system component Hcp